MSDYENINDLPLFGLCRTTDPATSYESAADTASKLVGLRQEFRDRLRAIGHPCTANEVAAGDESIRKRANECDLVVVYTRKCTVTGKSARCYWFPESGSEHGTH